LLKVVGVRPETDARARVALPDGTDLFQFRGLLAVGECHVILGAVALDPDFQLAGQGVDDRDANAVQPARELVVLVRKLSAGMQAGQDQFDARHALFGVDVDRHAAAVVTDLHRAVVVGDDVDVAGVAGQGLVDAVVDDLHREVVGSGRVGVHARPAPDRVQPGQDLDVFGKVLAGRHFAGSRGFTLPSILALAGWLTGRGGICRDGSFHRRWMFTRLRPVFKSLRHAVECASRT
jgi:hypothetical protein